MFNPCIIKFVAGIGHCKGYDVLPLKGKGSKSVRVYTTLRGGNRMEQEAWAKAANAIVRNAQG